MKLAKDPAVITAYVPKPTTPEETAEAAQASPEVDAAVREYVRRIAAETRSGVPPGAVSTTAGLSVGSPVPITPNAELLPLFGVNIFDANAANEQVSAISEALSAPSISRAQVLKLADNTGALLDQMVPNPTGGAGVAFHVIGLVRTLPRAAAALRKPGSKKTVEVGKSLFPVLAALGELVTDIPGLEHGKPVAESLSWVAKAGEQFLLVPVSAVPTAKPSPARAKVTNPPKSS
jgi:hypothetical protein